LYAVPDASKSGQAAELGFGQRSDKAAGQEKHIAPCDLVGGRRRKKVEKKKGISKWKRRKSRGKAERRIFEE